MLRHLTEVNFQNRLPLNELLHSRVKPRPLYERVEDASLGGARAAKLDGRSVGSDLNWAPNSSVAPRCTEFTRAGFGATPQTGSAGYDILHWKGSESRATPLSGLAGL